MSRARFLVLCLALGALCALAGPAAAKGQDVDVVVYLHDNPFHVAPERIEARQGDTVHLFVFNQGTASHDLVVCGDAPGPSSSCDQKWGFTPILAPNQRANITFVAEKSGTFEYFCDIPGHKSGGMRGTLSVQGSSGGGSPGAGLLVLLAAAGVAVWLRRP